MNSDHVTEGSEVREPISCCNDNAAADFSMLTVPEIRDIDFTKSHLWLAIFLVSVDPFYKPVVAVLEYKTRILSRTLGERASFDLYVICNILHSVLTFLSFTSTLRDQPLSEHLQSNKILLLAYILLLLGAGTKIHTFYSYGWRQIFGETYFKHEIVTRKEEKDVIEPLPSDLYYHPDGTASILCLIAISLFRASLAGVMICVLFALALFSAYQLEQFILKRDLSAFLQQSQFTKIVDMKNNLISDDRSKDR